MTRSAGAIPAVTQYAPTWAAREPWHVRASRLLILAVCIGYGIAGLIWPIGTRP
jgi:hypothetical protein